MVKAHFYAKSDVGCIREVNEDTFIAQKLWDERYLLFAAIDGLGGYEGGEIAAQIARDAILSTLTEKKEDVLGALVDSVQEANNVIIAKKKEMPQYAEMGCVLTVGILEIDEMRLNVAHVGDSRLYMYYGQKIQKLTHDHSFVGLLEDNGEISEELAMHHPKRNVISRTVGAEYWGEEGRQQIESGIYPVKSGMSFLFCSDGLTDMLTSNEIAEKLSESSNVTQKVEELIEMANQKGGKDNITVVLTSLEEYQSAKEIEKNKKQIKRERRKRKLQREQASRMKNDVPTTKKKTVLALLGAFLLGILVGYFMALQIIQ